MPAKNPRRLLVVFTKAGADKMPRLKNDAAAVHMVNSYVQVRRDSLRAGIPYLRFYYNHEGWWNTKEYVIQRMKEKIRG